MEPSEMEQNVNKIKELLKSEDRLMINLTHWSKLRNINKTT